MGEWERINVRVRWGDEHEKREKRWEREAKQSNEKNKSEKFCQRTKNMLRLRTGAQYWRNI